MSRAETRVAEEAQEYYDSFFDDELHRLLDDAESGDEDARESLEYRAYGIVRQVRYYITLAGGGPAARLVVEVDAYGDVESAWFEYQDWFTSWTEAPRQDRELVERYAEILGSYEP